ncbi:hypothetical protein ATJ97_1433 [Georgenia soli]|uniref:Uncharacterized protein n=1 Tax=Georgenia soli TaxID=638953 RepID=A0A2A9EK83_9MICO|nr:hypothetical protein [Georgenia soli]PFG38941.1 hypothetical protein ATJ97_1433 [Georgenia soli]
MPAEADREARRRRRAVLRAYHPDLGGDAEELIRQLQLLDRPAEEVVLVLPPRGLRAVRAWLRRRRRRRTSHPRRRSVLRRRRRRTTGRVR